MLDIPIEMKVRCAMSKKNSTLNMLKKTRLKKDWHKADVIAAVRKTGTNLQRLSIKHGFNATTLHKAVHTPAPSYERIIADHLGTQPHLIWPSRYRADGTPKSGRGERGLGRYKAKCKFNHSGKNDNVNHIDNQEAA